MQKLIRGIHQFQNHVFRSQKALFHELASGQKPSTLFITCSDSRIDPNLITQTDPGEIFVLRNAGNIVPPHVTYGGEIATIEFAIKALKIKDIVICGHSDCGAMKGLLSPGSTEASMPAVSNWLQHARQTVEIIDEKYTHLEAAQRLMAATQENVLVQIENLRTHQIIEDKLASGELNLHAWMYKFETGQVFSYEPESGQFVSMTAADDLRPMYPRCEYVDSAARKVVAE